MRTAERLLLACALLALWAPLPLAADPNTPGKPTGAPAPDAPGSAAAQTRAAADAPASAAPATERELDAAEALDLETRRAALRMLESELSAKLQELAQLQTSAIAQIEAERSKSSAQAEQRASQGSSADVQKLVSLYQAMKPKSAARLLEQLPLAVSTPVLQTMKPRPAGKILNELDPKLAAQISKRLAEHGS